MQQNLAIKIENVSKTYKLYSTPFDRMKEALHPFQRKYHQYFYALSNINFEVRKGETLGIIGNNGAGKSTLLKIITGVLTATQGTINVNGRISALLELGAGFNLEYTGIENIYFQASLLGMSRKEIRAQLDDILIFADIGDFIHQKVKIYSSGMFARLAFAIAIHVEPDILIVDEVLSVGDVNFQLKCHKRMDELRANGVTILFVSHDTYSVKTLCSRAIFLNHGVQTAYGHALDVVNEYLLFLDNEHKIKPKISEEIPFIDAPATILSVTATNLPLSTQGSVICSTGAPLTLQINYQINDLDINEIVLVFNLYRERDGVYICGTTTLMDGLPPIPTAPGTHSFQLQLPRLPLLSGKYRLRIAINEKKGVGIITERNDALILDVCDHHQAEGLMNLEREWLL